MRKFLILVVLIVAVYGFIEREQLTETGNSAVSTVDIQRIEHAFNNRQNDVQVEGEGVVSRILSDDNEGSRHQRFIVELSNNQTVLIAHNIDLAPRVEGLSSGDRISFYGEYEWNPQGGVVHWTHRDPAGRHADGWLEFKGTRYE